jgi:GT2 family glycosyltransferase
MHQISIIIITYNRPEDALELLQSIGRLQQKEALLKEVILLNNASVSDYSPVKEFILVHPESKTSFVDAPANLGVSAGRNFAAAMATGDLLFFLDDDTLIEDPAILQRILEAFARQTDTKRDLGVICGKVRYTENRELQVNAFPHKKFSRYKDKAFFLTGYYIGCAHIFTRACWLAAGNYPVDFFYGMEEYDESYRLIDAGYAIGYDASIEVFHKESPSGRAPMGEKLRMMWVNKSIVAWRYLPLVYFMTTAIGWSAFYLRHSRFHLPGYFKGWKEVINIPFSQQRSTLKKSSRNYLKGVKARLWF